MLTGTARVSSKGWVVIPKEIRDELGIQPGDEVRFVLWRPVHRGEAAAETLQLARVPKNAVTSLRGKYAPKPGETPWTEDLLEERRREREREERKAQRWHKRKKPA
jgi:AbrB family looped-hinge helix DNA binding protein